MPEEEILVILAEKGTQARVVVDTTQEVHDIDVVESCATELGLPEIVDLDDSTNWGRLYVPAIDGQPQLWGNPIQEYGGTINLIPNPNRRSS